MLEHSRARISDGEHASEQLAIALEREKELNETIRKLNLELLEARQFHTPVCALMPSLSHDCNSFVDIATPTYSQLIVLFTSSQTSSSFCRPVNKTR